MASRPTSSKFTGSSRPTCRASLARPKKALVAGDAVAVARAAHQAKGSAANFGFFGFSETTARIETQAKAGALAGIDAELALSRRLFADSSRR